MASGMMGMESGSEEAISPPSLSYLVDDKPFRATRVRSFRYVYQSFRPKELAYAGSYDAMGGGYGSKTGMGMPGGNGGGYPGVVVNSDQAHERLTIKIHAYLFDNEKVHDRTRIELMIEQPSETGMAEMTGAAISGMARGGYGAAGMSGEAGGYGGMSSAPMRMKPLASITTPMAKNSAKLLPQEIKLVTDIICQTIWKADVIKVLFDSKGQGESAAENEKFLKLLLADQYDTQLARQEMEAESIKRRLELLVDELKRRGLAKDRVVDVQLGRLILDAQGLLNNDR